MTSTVGQSARRIQPVILCGGAGTRLWPMSRSTHPKQLLPLVGSETMLQLTARRVADDSRFEPPIIVSGESHADAAAAQLAEAGQPVATLIVEPVSRNTAPAVALAALQVERDVLLLVMPSDHSVQDAAAFAKAVEVGRAIAESGWLVTFGVRPDRPETGYGYIKQGEEIASGVFAVDRFVEKPDAKTAEAYLAEGVYQWNAGIFLFSAGAYLDALAAHAPDLDSAARSAMAAAVANGTSLKPDIETFSAMRSISIDYAVMEPSDQLAVVPVDMAWSDVGSWEALYQLSAKDESGNAVSGDTIAIDSTDCLLKSDGPLVVAIGMTDLAIIVSDGAVLVAPRNESKRIQDVVAMLKGRNDRRA